MQYFVHATIINTSNHGLPQNRSRFWIVGIRQYVSRFPFVWPGFIPAIPLEQLLIPNANDPGHPDIRRSSNLATQQVQKAATYAADTAITGDWVIAEHRSKHFMPKPQPSLQSLAITAATQAGHCI